jgi:hypothetical protein
MKGLEPSTFCMARGSGVSAGRVSQRRRPATSNRHRPLRGARLGHSFLHSPTNTDDSVRRHDWRACSPIPSSRSSAMTLNTSSLCMRSYRQARQV